MHDLDRPIRLAEACRELGLTPSALRIERDRGRLVTFMIAGKEFTTMRHLKEMVATCAATAKVRGSGIAPSQPPVSGSSETDLVRSAQDAAMTIVERLREGSRLTSQAGTRGKRPATLS